MNPEPPSLLRAAGFVALMWLVPGVMIVGGTPHTTASGGSPVWSLLAADVGGLSLLGAVAGWLVHPFSPRRELVLYTLPIAVVVVPLLVFQVIVLVRSPERFGDSGWSLVQAVPLLLPFALPAAGGMRAVHAWREWCYQREALRGGK